MQLPSGPNVSARAQRHGRIGISGSWIYGQTMGKWQGLGMLWHEPRIGYGAGAEGTRLPHALSALT
jgi:hypothetical protein